LSNFESAGGAEYEFITQDHKTTIQMKLARRACLERDISRCAYFISRYVIGTSKNARLRARRGKDLNAAAPRARPRAGTHGTAQLQCSRAAGKPGANRALQPTPAITARDRGGFKGLERRGKKPRPLHERSFHLYSPTARQEYIESHVYRQ
jgi:hypothetical protein